MMSAAEKRKAKRYSCAVPLDSKANGAFAGSQAVDISRGGAGLIVRNPIALNTKMAVEIDFSLQGEPILAVGQVKWIQQVPNKDSYRVGLSFEDVKADSKSRLKKFIK